MLGISGVVINNFAFQYLIIALFGYVRLCMSESPSGLQKLQTWLLCLEAPLLYGDEHNLR